MLDTFFTPKGVAIIGASRNPHKLGYGVVRNLQDYHYQGAIYPINRSASEILGYTCYSDISEVPDPVDLAVLVVPAPMVPQTLEDCGKRGIENAIVVSGGFAETGAEGKQLEQELLHVAERYGIRVIGPNCIGTIDTHTPVNTTFVVGMPEQGEIGFSSQSGAMVAAVIDWARGAGVGFSRIVSLGNQIDVNETQMIEAIRSDRHTKVITAYIEGVSNGRAFLDVARETARKKPFVVLKGGQGESGAQAVASHTGALAGRSETYNAAFKRAGIQQASTMEEMFDWARALAWQPLPRGKRVAVLTNAGGPAILAVDAMEQKGLELAPLTDQTKDYLRSRLPRAASISNPIDILAGSGPGTYAVALDALLTDETVDAVVVIQAPQDWFLPASLAEVVGEVAGVHDKPVIASIMGKASVEEALAVLHKRKVPNVAFPERVASILSSMNERREWLEREEWKVDGQADQEYPDVSAAVADQDWKNVLEAYGIAFPEETIVTQVDEAVTTAARIGYPVVMKLVSEQISHKSDVGGVRLNLDSEDRVREAYQQMEAIADEQDADFGGVLIQPMLSGGQEVILGIRRDPQFGGTVLFGTGGVDVELLKDVAIDLAPLNGKQAEALIDQTRAGTKLKGWRNIPPADRDTVAEYLIAMAQLALDYPEIEELEINPLYVMPEGQGAYAVDVRGAVATETGANALAEE
jgi:acetyl coenzyme A synthetase (ADP forming)-like protein